MEIKKRESRIDIEKVVLRTLAVSGMITLALLAPNALMLLQQLDKGKARKKNPKYLIAEAINRLSRKKLIEVDSKTGKVALSSKGQKILVLLSEGKVKIRRKKNWDGKWRMVIFDISEKRRSSRRQLRFLLRNLGFFRLQDSVWVYPYEAEEIIILLKIDNFLHKEVLYLVVEKIENDEKIRQNFNI